MSEAAKVDRDVCLSRKVGQGLRTSRAPEPARRGRRALPCALFHPPATPSSHPPTRGLSDDGRNAHRREPMNICSTYQNIMAMPAKSWIDAATSALAGNPRMMLDVV